MATETTVAGQVSPDSLEAVGKCIDAHGGAIGMPQLCFEWFPNQMFWLAVTLVVIFLILSRVALPRIAAILAERRGTITADIAAAEDLKGRAVEAENAYDRALAEARSEAQRIAGQTRAEIRADLDKAIASADAVIAARAAESEKAIADIRASALESIEAVATDTAGALVSALGGKAEAGAVSGAVANRLKG